MSRMAGVVINCVYVTALIALPCNFSRQAVVLLYFQFY